MSAFPGFPNRRDYVAIPRLFFTDILPFIPDVAELLVSLQLFRLLGVKRGYPRAVSLHELAEDRPLVTGFSQLGRDFRQEIPRGLAAAVARGTFLQVTAAGDQVWVLLASQQDRQAAEAIQRGELVLSRDKAPIVSVPVALPQRDIFTLYEETIGTISSLIAEQLKEAEKEYPDPWIQEAFLRASAQNVRKWAYVEAILQRWKAEGKDDGTPRGHHQAARRVADYSSWLTPNRKKE